MIAPDARRCTMKSPKVPSGGHLHWLSDVPGVSLRPSEATRWASLDFSVRPERV